MFKFPINVLYPRRWTHRLAFKILAIIGFGFFLWISVQEIVQEDGYIFKRNRVLKCSLNDASGIPALSIGRARYGEGRMYRIYDYFITGTEWERLVYQYSVCFATQSSIERLFWLANLLEKWTGPLSVAVYIRSSEEWLILHLYMCYLSRCHPQFNSQVSIHITVPDQVGILTVDEGLLSQWNYTYELEEAHHEGNICPSNKVYLDYLLRMFPTLDKRKLRLKEVYPQNIMRNIARKACATRWTYSADIDLIPSNGMADMIQKFYSELKSNGQVCRKCAYVIPAFEIHERSKFPQSKKDIIRMYKDGTARQFHVQLYRFGHLATDYIKWISTNVEEGPVMISHSVDENLTQPMHHYEPFYVSSDDILPYDERFLGYGFTRHSQFRISKVAGWKYYVLTPVFSIHWGLQTSNKQFSPLKGGVGKRVRSAQIHANMLLFNSVMDEVNFKKELGTL